MYIHVCITCSPKCKSGKIMTTATTLLYQANSTPLDGKQLTKA